METIELKFLLKLLGFPGYQAPLAKIAPMSKMLATERERICRRLCDRGLVDYAYEICKLKIAPSAKALLKLDSDELPVTPQELKVLQACEKKAIIPKSTGIPEAERQTVIQSLADRGLIQVDKRDKKIKEVWLTERGKEFLRQEYDPKGASNITLTKTMLANYLSFLRQSLLFSESEDGRATTVSSQEVRHKLSDEEILQTIVDLDRKLGRNGLPIFYLREKLQPPLSRDDLDRALYRLEKNGQIELGAITRGWRYSEEELNAGIPQRAGSRLFFVTLT
jgi:DNA-binding MarR family transcriptional regulator